MTKSELIELLTKMPDDAKDITIGGNGSRLAFSSAATGVSPPFIRQQNQQWARLGETRFIEARKPTSGKGS